MNDIDLKEQKKSIREQARHVRNMLSLDSNQQKTLCRNFFDNINVNKGMCVSSYWPCQRELDTHVLMDELIEQGVNVALPIVDSKSRILKFAKWDINTPMQLGAHNIPHPEINDNTIWMKPDIFIIPLLAFDRNGYRLGYGGGYYDSTLEAYRKEKKVIAVGIAYAKQACLFPLPTEDHDQKMDWIITEQGATHY